MDRRSSAAKMTPFAQSVAHRAVAPRPLFGTLARRIVLASALLGAAAMLQADDAQPSSEAADLLTLEEATQIALDRNPLLRVVDARADLARAQLSEAAGGLLPTLRLSETITRSNNPVFVFGSLLEQSEFSEANFAIDRLNDPESLTNFRSAATLHLPLLNQLRTATRIQAARIGTRQVEGQREEAVQQIRFEVIRAYYGVLVAEGQLKVAGEAVRAASADADRIRDLVGRELVVDADLLAAEVHLADLHQQEIQARGNVEIARAALNTLLALPLDAVHQLGAVLPELDVAIAPEAELLRSAIEHRPELRQAALEIDAKQKEVQAALGQYLPRVEFVATVGNSGHEPASGSGDYALGGTLSFDLFDWGRFARVNQARARRDGAEAAHARRADEVRFEVKRALEEYRAAQARIGVAAAAIERARETLRIVRDRYEVGLTTITEMLRAHAALVRSELQLLTARYDQNVGYARILLAAGQLTGVDAFRSEE